MTRYVEASRTESLSTRLFSLAGRKATRIAYSYLVEAQERGREFPRLMQVYHDVVSLGEAALVFTYRAGAGYFEQGLPIYEKILESVRWDGE